jgi:hypothetical protein
MPFFARTKFEKPFVLSSKAPFASSKNFSFLHVEHDTTKLVYAYNTDQLYVTVKRQAHKLYTPDLERQVLRSSDGTPTFGLRFLERVYIVGAVFEVMQSWCNQHAHLRWGTLEIEERPDKNAVSGVAIPVTNPSHRNVLDCEEQAENLLTVAELE